MLNANRLFLWFLGFLLFGGLTWYAYWFAANFEQQSKEVRTDISPEARKNPFLAAEHFLIQTDQAVQSHAGHDIFSLNPAHNDTIVIGSQNDLFLEQNQEQLLEWIRAGGTLIFVPKASYLDQDMDVSTEEEEDSVSGEQRTVTNEEKEKKETLLERLGAELQFVDAEQESGSFCEDDPDFCDEGAVEQGTDEENSDKSLGNRVMVTFRTSHPGEFKAQFLTDRYLLDAKGLAEVIIGEQDAPHLLRYSLERGTVILLSDMNLFTNGAIAQYDHAYLFHQLVHTPGKVWIFYSVDMPSLLALLWRWAPYFSLLVITLLLMAGWRMVLHSGPQLRPQYEARRNLLEHLDATAQYSWRIDKARALLSDNRHAIEQAWCRRHPQLNSMNQSERCEWFGEQTGITPHAVERSLYGEIASEQDFIRATAVMQRLASRIKHVMVSASSR